MRKSLGLLLTTVVATLALGALAGPALADPPTNDNFADAQQLSGNRGSTGYDLTEASNEVGEPLVGNATDRTAWFRYTPTDSGFARFSNCRSESDLAMEGGSIAVYTGSQLSALASTTSSTDGCTNGFVNAITPNIAVTAGTTYWIQLEASSTAEITGGSLTFDFNTAVPTNDNFADASEITGALPQTLDADTGLATLEDSEPDFDWFSPNNSRWWSWTADHDGMLAIDTCSSEVDSSSDSRIHVYTDGDPDPDIVTPNYLDDNDDGCPAPNSLLSHLFIHVTSDETYFVRVSNYHDGFGADFKLKLHWVTDPELQTPPRVDPTDARILVGQTFYGDVGDWTADPGVDSTDYAWKRCDADGENCVPIDGETGTSYQAQAIDLGHRIVFTTNAHRGSDDFTADSPPSGLVSDRPANDNLADATDLGSTAPTTVAADNYLATMEPGESDLPTDAISGSIWYRWTAPASRVYYVDNCADTGYSSFMANVFTSSGSQLSDLSVVSDQNGGCGGDSESARVFFTAEAGTSYLIQVGSPPSSTPTDFSMTISEAPAPSFFGTPYLQGSLLEGTSLTAVFSAVSNPLPRQKTVVWEDCFPNGTNCSAQAEQGVELPLTHSMVGHIVKATMTITNANGSVSQTVTSGVIIGDNDNDAVPDEDDTCPNEAGSRPNGCDPSVISNDTPPEISGSTSVGDELTGWEGDWSVAHDPLGYTLTSQWQRCATANAASCSNITGADGETYTLTSADSGKFIRLLVTATNDDDVETAASDFTAAVTGPPAPPPTGNGGGSSTTPPPPAINPLTLTVKKSLGKLTPKKGVLTIKGAIVSCAASASGPCRGTATFKSGPSSTKYIEFPFLVAPGKSAPVSGKIKSSKLKAIKKAKSVKTTATFSFAAPGFAPTVATATATLKPQKK